MKLLQRVMNIINSLLKRTLNLKRLKIKKKEYWKIVRLKRNL